MGIVMVFQFFNILKGFLTPKAIAPAVMQNFKQPTVKLSRVAQLM